MKLGKVSTLIAMWLPFVLIGVTTLLVIIEGVKAYQWTGG